jgi:hypothetical protein
MKGFFFSGAMKGFFFSGAMKGFHELARMKGFFVSGGRASEASLTDTNDGPQMKRARSSAEK